MADFLSRTLARALNQFLLLFGGILVFAFLLSIVAMEIRSAGESVMGNGYYYLVAPGVVCHETGHAIGCLMTGTKIVHFEPFRIRGRELGHVYFRPHEGNVRRVATEWIAASGPIWFGCFVIWLLSKLCTRSFHTPKFCEVFPCEPIPCSGKYWVTVFKMSFRRLFSILKMWRLSSTWNVLYLYLLFCIASEMALSPADLLILWPGLLSIAIVFLVLNIIPRVGLAVSIGVYRFAGIVFPVHVNLAFILLLSLVFFVFFSVPIKLLH